MKNPFLEALIKAGNEQGLFDEWRDSLDTSNMDDFIGFNENDYDEADYDSKKEFEEVVEEDRAEKLEDYFQERSHEFITEFGKISRLQSGGLKIFRCVTVADAKKYAADLKKGKYPKGFSGLGIFWSWDESAAECHWGDSKHADTIVLEGLAPLNAIDFRTTVVKNLHISMGDEKEIQLKEGAKIKLIAIEDESRETIEKFKAPLQLQAEKEPNKKEELKEKYGEKENTYLYFPVSINGEDDFHLTVKFLGKSPATKEELLKALEDVDTTPPENFQWEAVTFDSKNDGDVKVLELTEFPENLKDLHDSLEQFREDDYPEYRPHITVEDDLWEKIKRDSIQPGHALVEMGPLSIDIRGEKYYLAKNRSAIATWVKASIEITASYDTLINKMEKVLHDPHFDFKERGLEYLHEELDEDANEDDDALKDDPIKKFEKIRTDFKKYGKTKNGNLLLWRCVSVEDPKKFLDILKRQEYLENFSGVGKHWSYTEKEAVCIWAYGTHDYQVVLEAEVPISSVDAENTLIVNLVTWGEREIRLVEGAPLKLLRYKVSKVNEKTKKFEDFGKALPAEAAGWYSWESEPPYTHQPWELPLQNTGGPFMGAPGATFIKQEDVFDVRLNKDGANASVTAHLTELNDLFAQSMQKKSVQKKILEDTQNWVGIDEGTLEERENAILTRAFEEHYPEWMIDLERKGMVENSNIFLYRGISENSVQKIDFNRLGVYWTWDKEKASNYSGKNTDKKLFIIKAKVPFKSIDFDKTLRKLVWQGYERAESEHEFELKPRAPIEVVMINDQPTSQKAQAETYEDEGHVGEHWGTQASGIMFICDGKVLLLKRADWTMDPGLWGIAGGAVPVDKSGQPKDVKQSAMDEVSEEMGGLPPHTDTGKSSVYQAEDGFKYTTFVFEVPETFEPILNSEHERAQWFPLNELPEDIHPGVMWSLNKMGFTKETESSEVDAAKKEGKKLTVPPEIRSYIRGDGPVIEIDEPSIKVYHKAIQPMLKKLYPTGKVKVYRAQKLYWHKEDEDQTANQCPPELACSFSTSKQFALNLAAEKYDEQKDSDADDETVMVIELDAPLDRIYFHHALDPIGKEHPNEKEVIVNAAGLPTKVIKYYKSEIAASMEDKVESFLPENLVMIDGEFTNVNPKRDHLLQAAFLKLKLKDHQYVEVDEPLVLYMQYKGKPTSDFHKEHLAHIFEKCNDSNLQPGEAKQQICKWLGELKGKVQPTGDCVHKDMAFLLEKGLIDDSDISPDGTPIPGTFHYENFEMHPLKTLARHKQGAKKDVAGVDKENEHDALVDCRNQLLELNDSIKVLVPDMMAPERLTHMDPANPVNSEVKPQKSGVSYPKVSWLQDVMNQYGFDFQILEAFIVGSVAKEQEHEGSDLDILMVVPKELEDSIDDLNENLVNVLGDEIIWAGRKVDFQVATENDPDWQTWYDRIPLKSSIEGAAKELPEPLRPNVRDDRTLRDSHEAQLKSFEGKALRADDFQAFQELLSTVLVKLELTEDYRKSVAGILNQFRERKGYVAL
jgi:8-oxo-dGTP pyrophosphatase MutT (NUDIX family)/oligoribonuclease (3'-5' exoribonuclease)/predicted nucleotidyltransferase